MEEKDHPCVKMSPIPFERKNNADTSDSRSDPGNSSNHSGQFAHKDEQNEWQNEPCRQRDDDSVWDPVGRTAGADESCPHCQISFPGP